MKKWILLVGILCSLIPNLQAQQNDINELSKGIYLVVGSFQIKANALKFSDKLKDENYAPSISYSAQTGFYYVHIKSFNSIDEGIPEVKTIRANTEFNDAWVLAYSPATGLTATSTIPVKNNSKTDSLSSNTVNEVDASIVSPAIVASDSLEQNTTIKPIAIEKYNPERFKTEKNQYKFIFNTYNFVTKAKVTGKVNVIDPDRLKIIRGVPTNELEYVNDPHNQSHSLEFIAEIFGYKKAQHNLNLIDEMSDDTKAFLSVDGDIMTIDFPLKRYEKGDVAIMYNVFFYKDAAIMKPESQFELNSLLEFLKEKSGYKIKISGHTNGNARGKIIENDEDVPDYFSLKNATKEKNGSAKKLSLKRAEIIKKYLVNNGISADRMEVKGYGGKMPLYDKFDRLASKNVRVEIEILEE